MHYIGALYPSYLMYNVCIVDIQAVLGYNVTRIPTSDNYIEVQYRQVSFSHAWLQTANWKWQLEARFSYMQFVSYILSNTYQRYLFRTDEYFASTEKPLPYFVSTFECEPSQQMG